MPELDPKSANTVHTYRTPQAQNTLSANFLFPELDDKNGNTYVSNLRS